VYKSKFMESYITDLNKSIKNIIELLKKYRINFSIIGGTARNQYGYQKITEDIDLLIAKEDKEKLKNIPIGYLKDISNKRARKFQLHDPETIIEIIYEGEISGDGIHGLKYPSPEVISKNNIISLKYLIMFKLSSGLYGIGRYKDFDDIFELIKRNKLTKDYADKFRKDLKEKYAELWKEVQGESN